MRRASFKLYPAQQRPACASEAAVRQKAELTRKRPPLDRPARYRTGRSAALASAASSCSIFLPSIKAKIRRPLAEGASGNPN